MTHKKTIRRILREESNLQKRLLSMIEDIGFKRTSIAVGGAENLFKILEKKKDLVMGYLLSFFDDLRPSKFRDELHLSQKYNTFIEKTSGLFLGGYIKVFDDHLRSILEDVPEAMYKQYRRDLLKELISRYFQLDKKTEVTVFADRGLYRTLDKFYVGEENNEEVISESSSIQERLNSLMKTSGVVIASKAVGGLNNLIKILKLDLEDVNVQEMLVKNYIYFANVEDIEVDFIEVKNRDNRKLIKIYFETDSNASNMESWYCMTIRNEMNDFFPFKVDVSWHPVNYPKSKIMIDAVIGGVVDFPD
jgi:hypothetical protein